MESGSTLEARLLTSAFILDGATDSIYLQCASGEGWAMAITGHNLQYAVFCQELKEVDGGTSISELIDVVRIVRQVKRGGPRPQNMIPVRLLLGLTGPGSGGSHRILVQAISPSGSVMPSSKIPEFLWPKGDYIHRILMDLDVEVVEGGLYTFKILLDGVPVGQALLDISHEIEYTD